MTIALVYFGHSLFSFMCFFFSFMCLKTTVDTFRQEMVLCEMKIERGMLSTEQHTLKDLMCNFVTILFLLLMYQVPLGIFSLVRPLTMLTSVSQPPMHMQRSNRPAGSSLKDKRRGSDACRNWNFIIETTNFCWQVTLKTSRLSLLVDERLPSCVTLANTCMSMTRLPGFHRIYVNKCKSSLQISCQLHIIFQMEIILLCLQAFLTGLDAPATHQGQRQKEHMLENPS